MNDPGIMIKKVWMELSENYPGIETDAFVVMPNHFHGIVILNNVEKLWQRNYYEHIVRNDEDLNRIREYIENNPRNWVNDENYSNNTNQ